MPNGALVEQLLKRIRDLEQWRDRLILPEIEYPVRAQHRLVNVSNPPTDAELDTAFGTPATVGAGFLAIVTDTGIGGPYWLVASNGTYWLYEELTLAV